MIKTSIKATLAGAVGAAGILATPTAQAQDFTAREMYDALSEDCRLDPVRPVGENDFRLELRGGDQELHAVYEIFTSGRETVSRRIEHRAGLYHARPSTMTIIDGHIPFLPIDATSTMDYPYNTLSTHFFCRQTPRIQRLVCDAELVSPTDWERGAHQNALGAIRFFFCED